MTKAELETKHLSDLHALAADAGVEKFRMLTKGELVERLADGDGGSSSSGSGSRSRSRSGSSRGGGGSRGGSSSREETTSERPPRRRSRSRRDGGPDEDPSEGETPRESRDRPKRSSRSSRPARSAEGSPERERESEAKPERESETPREADTSESSRPRRRRRRRPFGRRDKGEVTIQGLLLPPEPGRQAIVYGETREACTALLRNVATDIAADAKGPDPVALLIDPSPEELADWRREAPQAEIVAAGQPRHATDALAQAVRRAGDGEDIFLLIDSLSRLAEATGDADSAKELFDAGREQAGAGGGSLTVVAALETPAAS